MKLTMLGTGNALTTECYNTCFLLSEKDKHFLVDGGGGNQILSQLKRSGNNWADIKDIFVTHKHIDHLLGIIWLIRIICQHMAKGDYIGDANIYAHEDLINLIKELSEKLLQKKESQLLNKRLHLVAITNNETLNIIGHKTTFFDIGSTKAKQFGFSMELGNGEKLTCCGDEPYNETEKQYVQNSTWLLHEAFCLASEADIFSPYEKHHSTVKDACILAEQLNIKNLVLYHTEDKNIQNRKTLYKNEGKQYYSGNLFIPNDLEVININ